jgi:hypothetical protein
LKNKAADGGRCGRKKSYPICARKRGVPRPVRPVQRACRRCAAGRGRPLSARRRPPARRVPQVLVAESTRTIGSVTCRKEKGHKCSISSFSRGRAMAERAPSRQRRAGFTTRHGKPRRPAGQKRKRGPALSFQRRRSPGRFSVPVPKTGPLPIDPGRRQRVKKRCFP